MFHIKQNGSNLCGYKPPKKKTGKPRDISVPYHAMIHATLTTCCEKCKAIYNSKRNE